MGKELLFTVIGNQIKKAGKVLDGKMVDDICARASHSSKPKTIFRERNHKVVSDTFRDDELFRRGEDVIDHNYSSYDVDDLPLRFRDAKFDEIDSRFIDTDLPYGSPITNSYTGSQKGLDVVLTALDNCADKRTKLEEARKVYNEARQKFSKAADKFVEKQRAKGVEAYSWNYRGPEAKEMELADNEYIKASRAFCDADSVHKGAWITYIQA